MAEKKKGFDLAAALSDVSNLNTGAEGREQIAYIDFNLLRSDDRNFYAVDGIEELAANIEFAGLQQPIRVRPDDKGVGYVIVSGHRRHAALRKLLEDGVDRFQPVPCIVERDTATGETAALLQELRLIYANSDTRRMSSADLAKQAERVEMLLYQLKEAGVEFPGRMRDHVAEACKLSASKLARLKVIREKLIPELKKYWDTGKMNDAVAYACAQHSAEMQRRLIEVSKVADYWQKPTEWYEQTVTNRIGYMEADASLDCKMAGEGCKCDNLKRIERCIKGGNYGDHCRTGRCCSRCPNLTHCKSACPHLADEIAKAKTAEKSQKAKDKAAAEAAARPDLERITALWQRFASVRRAAGLSLDEYAKAVKLYLTKDDIKLMEAMDQGKKITANSRMIYLPCITYLSQIGALCRAADVLGVSLDYLLCRTDDPAPASSADAAPQWHTGTPPKSGQYVCEVASIGGCEYEVVRWNAELGEWRLEICGYKDSDNASVERWFPLPADEKEAKPDV